MARTIHETHIDFPVGTRVRNSDLTGHGMITDKLYLGVGKWQYHVVSYDDSIKDRGALMTHPDNPKKERLT